MYLMGAFLVELYIVLMVAVAVFAYRSLKEAFNED